jgi:hypothetical protein
MKKAVFYLSILLLFLINASCNKRMVTNKTILCSQETFVLNSVNKTTFANGINRNYYTTKIPKRTKFIVIQVQVDSKDSEKKQESCIELLNSLAKSGVDSNFKLAGGAAIALAMPPSTGKYCDFFMFPDRNNFEGFMEKGDVMNWKDNWKSLDAPYKKLNTQYFNLVVDVNDLTDKENLYLGFLNHSLTSACRIFLDVIAVK